MKINHRLVLGWTTALLMVSLSGCMGCFSSSSEDETEVTDEGNDINSPLGMLGALNDMANKAKGMQEELENMKPVDPVHFNVLIAALPDAPDGFTESEPTGETNQMGNFSTSSAQKTFKSDEKEVTVVLTDFAFNKVLYAPFALSAAFSQESTSGYNKGITIGEDPGREEYEIKSKRGKRQVLLRKRFHTEIRGKGIEPDDFDYWYQLIKRDELPAESAAE